ncbi:hypothetical protein LTR56_021565 [Elasticomyces elasticus]|nr:hypothetical protein LTR56_021565 [Elasticomyces elasticus]KAK3626015.1 hypothetical protein LTR22_023323 [Elasticomyces elasticus]KAK4926755.1 hypothetical protein LTR49_006437 [Elasticomyces elasticus]KAK5741417.1 hypothetical protein LTS12_024616 [Elasticomyces elasticus]
MAFGLTMFAIFGCLFSTISAAPQPGTPTLVRRDCKNLDEQTAAFEDVPKKTGLGSLPELPGNPFEPIPTPYKYLSWEGFTYGKALKVPVLGQKFLPGINLETPTHFAATGVVVQSASGKKPTLTAVYSGSTVPKYTLNSFAYACVLNLENRATDPATPCTVTLTGYKQGVAEPKCTMDFDYNPPDGDGRKDMANTAELGLDLAHCFQDVAYIEFEYTAKLTGATVDSPLIALAVDTVEFTPYSCTTS